MIVRELFVSLGIIPNEQQFRRVEKRIADVRHAFFLLSAGVATAGAIIGKSLSEAAGSADQLDDLSQKTGVGTTALQELAYAAEQSGSSAEALNGAFAPLARQMGAAAAGSQEAASAFSALGVKVTNADGSLRPMEAVLADSADGIAALTSDAARGAAAMKIFGRSGSELVPLLKNGSQAIADLRAEAQELGFVMDEATVQAFAGFADKGKRVHNVALGLSRAFAKGLLPSFQAMFDRLLAVNKISGETIRLKLEDWGKRLGEVFGRVDQVITSLMVAGRGILGIFGSMPAVFQTALGLLALLALAFFSPAIGIALLIAAIVAVIDEFRAFNDGVESVFDNLLAMMPDWLRDFTAFVMAIFAPLVDPEAWQNVIDYWQESLFSLFAVSQEIWGVISSFFGDALFAFVDGFVQAFAKIGEIAGKINKLSGGALTTALDVATGGASGVIGSLFGSGATPAASPGASANTTVNAPATNNFVINAAPGMSTKDVANSVVAAQNSASEDQLRAAHSQFGGQ